METSTKTDNPHKIQQQATEGTLPQNEPPNQTLKFERDEANIPVESRGYVAINHITAQPEYAPRMERLFQSRSSFIDNCQGFRSLRVLRPREDAREYLVITEWDSEADFIAWTNSAEFQQGYRRAFEDLAHAQRKQNVPPMNSKFITYDLIERA